MKKILNHENGLTKVITINERPSLTQQNMKAQCDINNIIKKYKATGSITHLSNKQGLFADLSDVTDYQSSLNTILKAQEAFDALSADLRKRFNNQPKLLLEFLSDPSNREEATKLGLINNPQQPQTPQTPQQPQTPQTPQQPQTPQTPQQPNT